MVKAEDVLDPVTFAKISRLSDAAAKIDGVIRVLDPGRQLRRRYLVADKCRHAGCRRPAGRRPAGQQEEKRFGERGCLFFYMGCHGPLVTGPCNKALWNRRSSKTRVGVPCFAGYPRKLFNSGQIKWTDLILPEDRAQARQVFIEALKGRFPRE
ncbi:hypothetical protein [Desulfosarcina ovata]|uniref:Cytochrome-c3 hydrogenase C-terminal domain-containing protein n=2 Tax=Desulfosarcina ovata TaxID=83564 RepID=A0A5K8AKK7_9BACT|nr:hypothetical protein [Desulfosarcina ovata]BBO86326.1 hypothetical protein DSCO28_68920 [Desulfosarcina ovata subsp. sediminis]BBO93267.1 hypothetical protein DSCOOX_64470 [Desulfosarcina ovata subsp. ovata]